MDKPILYMLLLGCKPAGRHTEQHDVFFTIGHSLVDTIPAVEVFWPEAKGNMHLDAWREVTQVNGYDIMIQPREMSPQSELSLFFINLGGYKLGEFEEFHYKMLIVARNIDEAKTQAKATAFFKHTGIKGDAAAHIDDKYGIDADDVHNIADILPQSVTDKYCIYISPSTSLHVDEFHLGYLPTFRIK
jgi:hypothetical protein